MFDETLTNNVDVLFTSCDKYQDLWGPFFTLFFRYWQDCPYLVYIGSNHFKYDHERVNTIAVIDSPIPYFCTGVVKGKWVKEAVKLCETEGIEVDLTARSMQTPVDRLLRSARVGRLIEYIRNVGDKNP